MTHVKSAIRIAPLSIKGRYFLFAQDPPTVMMVDTATAAIAHLLSGSDAELSDLRTQYREATGRRGVAPDVADAQFEAALSALSSAGLVGASTSS
ncbi:hypothetical protein AB0B56_05665 [Streptosporangium canum]|uniref:hypothetical protein n=1 Tax=Streptosporangium canum TaxID=324952 RepID=UPI003439322C